MTTEQTILPVILAGGHGTRLWPASLPHIPKQFIKIGQHSLIFESIKRAHAISNQEIVVITGAQYIPLFSELLKEELMQAAIDPNIITLIGEPLARNTAPAIALAVRYAQEKDSNAILMVMTADHLITPIEVFVQDVKHAIAIAENTEVSKSGNIVTFGITPTRPETGYGYLEEGGAIVINNTQHGTHIKSFREKPEQETAKEYLRQGNFLWNSGMFCFPARLMAQELQMYCPQLYQLIVDNTHASGLQWGRTQQDEFTILIPLQVNFEHIDKISIDYAVMEHTTHATVVRAQFDWNDIGSWDEAAPLLDHTHTQDDHKETSSLLREVVGAHNVSICADVPVGVSGVSDIIVVAQNNRVLVLKKGLGQTVSTFALHDKVNSPTR